MARPEVATSECVRTQLSGRRESTKLAVEVARFEALVATKEAEAKLARRRTLQLVAAAKDGEEARLARPSESR